MELDILMKLPNFKRVIEKGTIYREMQTIFVSNTYPIHTSVVTGEHPKVHGITSNLERNFLDPRPRWNYDSRKIKVDTLWDILSSHGLKTAAVLWPVTGYSKNIAYNIPEIVKKPEENQIVLNFKTGSKLLQIEMFIKYGKILKGIRQPELDTFSTACMVDIIKKKKADLMLLHLTIFDNFCHFNGREAIKTKQALKILDKNLGKVLDVIDNDTTVIIFSDHAQIDVHSNENLNRVLNELGYLQYNHDGSIKSYKAVFENCGGSCFLHASGLDADEILNIQAKVLGEASVKRLLTAEEMENSGFGDAICGFAANIGYHFCDIVEKANHGYPLDVANYHTFCVIDKKTNYECRSVLDIKGLVLESLGRNF